MAPARAYLGLLACLLSVAQAQQCISFDDTPSVFLMCSSIVDYAFYVPAGYSAADLDSVASETLSSTMLSMLPTTCLGTLKSLVCSSVFNRCIDGGTLLFDLIISSVDLADYSTYDIISYNGSYSILPFSRPCLSSCEATQSTCGALLSLFSIDVDCTEINPQTQFPMYSDGETDGQCHTSPEAGEDVEVQHTHELYLGYDGGVCSGNGYDEIFVPPAQKVMELLAPLQPPYVVQTLIEQALSSSMSELPLFLTDECNAAIRNWFCASSFMPAERVTVEPIATYLPDLYLPQYPSRELCLDYKSACAAFIIKASVENPALDVDCYQIDEEINDYKYPLQNETRLIAAFTLPYYGTIVLQTDANSMESSEIGSNYMPTCPYGFVVPEDPSHGGINWVPATGCAVQCPLPFFTEEEFATIFNLCTVLCYLSQICFALCFATYYMFPEKRKNGKMFMYFLFLVFLENFAMNVQMATSSNYEDTVCSTNATGSTQEDGELCAYTGAIVLWTVRAAFTLWTFQAFDLFLRVVLQMKGIDHYIKYYIALSLIIPTGFLIGMASRGVLGYGDGHTTCAIAGDGSDLEAFILYPDLVSHFIGTCLVVASLVVMFGITRKTSDGTAVSWKRSLKMFRTPLLFVFVFLAATAGFAAYEWQLHMSAHAYQSSMVEWTECIFGEFAQLNSVGDKSEYLSICGATPKLGPPISAVYYNIYNVAGTGFMAMLVLFNGEVISKWLVVLGLSKSSNKPNKSSVSPEEVEMSTANASVRKATA